MRLPPIPPESFNLPDEQLGKLLLGYFIAANAEKAGFDPFTMPQQYAERILQLARELPDDHSSAENDSVLLAVRLAAQGKFDAAGNKLKAHMHHAAMFMASVDMVSNLKEDTKAGVKVRRSTKLGHEAIHGNEVEKITRWGKYQEYINELFYKNPHLSYSDLQREAAKHFKVSAKTIQRRTANPKESEQS